MRADMRVYIGDGSEVIPDPTGHINSILSAAIINGLDVVGIVAPQSPAIGWQAQQLATQNGIDLWVLPGEEYYCADKVSIVAYLLKEPLPIGLDSQAALAYIRKQGGFSMVFNISKRQAQTVNKYKGTSSEPNAVEIYNAVSGGYQDIEVDYPKFVSSASVSAADLEKSNVFTLISRKDLTSYGLIPEHIGENYTPSYLQNEEPSIESTQPSDAGLTP